MPTLQNLRQFASPSLALAVIPGPPVLLALCKPKALQLVARKAAYPQALMKPYRKGER